MSGGRPPGRVDAPVLLRLGVLGAALAAALFVGREAQREELEHWQWEELGRRAELVREALARPPAGASSRAGEGGVRARLAALALAAGAELQVVDAEGGVRFVASPGGATAVRAGRRLPEALRAVLDGRTVRRRRADGWLEVAIPADALPGAVVVAAPPRTPAVGRGALVRGAATGLLVALLLGLPAELVLRREVRRRLESLLGALEARARGGAPPPPVSEPLARRLADSLDALRRELEGARAETDRLRVVLASMVEGVLVVDRSRRILLANPPLREILDTRGPLEGRRVDEVLRERTVEAAIARALEGEEVTVEAALPGRVLLLRAGPYPRRGAPEGAVALFHDVTELRRLERLRRELVANVSHELRTPLTAIRGFAEMLRDAELSPAERGRHLEVILRHAGRLERLTDDLLELARLEGGERPLHPEPVDPAALARRLLRELAPLLERRGLEARVEEEAGGPIRALADPRALEEVLVNLLDNAVKYTEPGGRIALRALVREGQVRIEVEDTGIGIPASDLPRIFERFYRVDKGRSRELGGTGLGLAIVKHLVQAMGGEVGVSSRLGAGTRFRVDLPAVPEG